MSCSTCKGEGDVREYDIPRRVWVVTVCHCQPHDNAEKDATKQRMDDILELYGE